jgi:hypothetical protein
MIRVRPPPPAGYCVENRPSHSIYWRKLLACQASMRRRVFVKATVVATKLACRQLTRRRASIGCEYAIGGRGRRLGSA